MRLIRPAQCYLHGQDDVLGPIYGKTTLINAFNQEEANLLAEAFNQKAGKTVAKAYHTNSGEEPLEEFNKSLSVVLSDTLHTMQESINAIMNRLDGDNQARIDNARTNLHDAVNSHYIGRKAVRYWALELNKCSLNDFEANFYIDFLKFIDKPDEVVRNIDNIEVNEHYECLERLIVFVIKSLKSKYGSSRI